MTLSATDGAGGYSFAVSAGALPSGLRLSTGGAFEGSPTPPGTARFEVTVTDSNLQPGPARPLSLGVYALPTVATATLPEARTGQSYSESLTASGGKADFSWSHTGSLPPGLGLSSAGVLSGPPTTAGLYTFTARVTDANGRAASRTLSVSVTAASSALFTVAHWNIEWFGDSTHGPDRSTSDGGTPDDLQIANARDIIRDAGIPLWGLSEIVDVNDFATLKAQLPGYDGFVASDTSRVPGGSSWYSTSEQKVAVLYDSTLTFQRAKLILTEHNYDFGSRPPLRVDFTTTIDGVRQSLVAIVLHMKAFDDQASYDRRQRASLALKQYLDTYLPYERVFVIGDWNDDVDVSITPGTSDSLPTPYKNFVDDSLDYAFVTQALSQARVSTTASGPETIDHTLVTNELMPSYVPNSVAVMRPDSWVAETAYEFIEVVNGGPTTVDLGGWSLWDSGNRRHTFAAGTTLAPGKSYVVYGGSAAVPPGATHMTSASTGSLGLNNTSDAVRLMNPHSVFVDKHAYSFSVLLDNVSHNRNPEGNPDGGFVPHTSLSSLTSSAGLRSDGGAW